jgi:hypothetical protein
LHGETKLEKERGRSLAPTENLRRWVMPDQRDLLEVLKSELKFLQKGGYRSSPRNPWRPQFVFEDSPTCLNAGVGQNKRPCTECILIELVPPEQRQEEIPCRHIRLNETGETVDYFYRCGTQQELERALEEWLRKTILGLEKQRDENAILVT